MCSLTTLTDTRFTRWLISHSRLLLICALVGLAILLASPELKLSRPAKAVFFAARYVATTGSDAGGNTCTNPLAPCQTINYAIGQAAPGDTINVAAGTYTEQVTVNKTLTLLGAKANVDARTRSTVGESIMTGPLGITPLIIAANNVVINGFTIQGNTDNNNQGYGIVMQAGTSGTQLLNNIIQNNIAGVALANNSAGNQTVIQQNLFSNNNNPGSAQGAAIYSDQFISGGLLTNVLIDNNKFVGNGTPLTNDGGIDFSSTAGPATQTNITISNNEFDNNARAMFLLNVTTATITKNFIHNSNDSATADIRIFGGVSNVSITSNTILNGAGRGLRINDGFGGNINSNITISCNRIVGNAVAGLIVDDALSYTGTLKAENNWWGCNAGPGGAGCDTVVAPDNNVDFNPWLVLTLTANPNPVAVGGTSALTASLNTNSAGGTALCSVLDGTPVAFSSSCGTVNPANTSTTNGTANSTLTATTVGACTINSTVDNQTVILPFVVNPGEVLGPGAVPPIAAAVSGQKAGSVLIYNLYTSDPTNLTRQNTRINLTNVNLLQSAAVHLFFIDGNTCTPADYFVCLTPSQTLSFLASDIDPGTTGYIVAIASDAVTGCPINFNFLIGDEFVKLTSGHAANLAAESFSALASTQTGCSLSSLTATLNFDGVQYNQVPKVLALDNFPSRVDGNNTLLILNRIGGDLSTAASRIGAITGVLYDEAEQPFSFTFNADSCQFRGSLSNNLPRILQRLDTIVPSGRSGWMRFWAGQDSVAGRVPQVQEVGLLGAVINFNSGTGASVFNQGHNLHKLTFTSATLTIPIIPPRC